MKQEIKVIVFEDESCIYSLPEKPDEFLAWWTDKLKLIPEECKESARIECSTSTYYDSIQFSVIISFKRIETDEEEADRIKREDAKREFLENQELCQLERLKTKYGV